MAIISLRDVVDAMEDSTGDTVSYLDPDTAEIITIAEDERRWAEGESEAHVPEWARAMLPKIRAALEDDRLLQLPDRFEIDEWSIMEEFSQAQGNQRVRQQLLNAIHGAGAFRIFKSEIKRLGIETDWCRFREETLEKIARDWLDANRLRYQ